VERRVLQHVTERIQFMHSLLLVLAGFLASGVEMAEALTRRATRSLFPETRAVESSDHVVRIRLGSPSGISDVLWAVA
jgi:hypothetical protein